MNHEPNRAQTNKKSNDFVFAKLLLRRLLLVAVGYLCAANALAQQPFVTDDADVTERRRFHLEFINEFDFLNATALPTKNQNTTRALVAYGLVKRVEISVSAPFVALINLAETIDTANNSIDSRRLIAGVGDTTFAVKYNFLKEPENSLLPALTVTAAFDATTGSAARGLGSGANGLTFNAVAQKNLTKKMIWRLNGGFASAGGTLFLSQPGQQVTTVERTRGRVLIGATSVVRTFSERLRLGAEIAGAKSSNSNLSRGLLLVQIGGNYSLSDKISLDFGILGGRFAAPRIGAQIGTTIDF